MPEYLEREAKRTAYIDENLADRTEQKFKELPTFYKSTDGQRRYTNISDMIDGLTQIEFNEIARLLVDGKFEYVGIRLKEILMIRCKNHAEEELENEAENLF